MCASCAVMPSEASTISSATWQRSRLLSAMTTESFSSASETRPLRRMPAVSTGRRNGRERQRRVHAVARGARRGVDEHPRLTQHRVDEGGLAHVRPAHDGHTRALDARRGGDGGRGVADGLEQLGDATPVLGRDGEDAREAQPVHLAQPWLPGRRRPPCSRPPRRARPLRRRMCAISTSTGVSPSRVSTVKTTRSASSMACMIWARIAATRSSVEPGSKPPVSTTVPCHRSKVTVP